MIEPGTIVWDSGRGSVPGFGLRRQKVARVFILKYNIRGRSRWFTIGKVSAPWTVDSARTEAKRLLGEVARGGDPGQERTSRNSELPLLMSEFFDRYLDAAQAGLVLTRFNRPKKSSTLGIDRGRVERHLRPLLGHLEVSAVDSQIVKRMISQIAAGVTATDVRTKSRGRAIVKGGHGTAARVADLLSGMMSWAVDEKVIATNPVHGVRRYRGLPRDRYLSKVELRHLGEALRAENAAPTVHPFALAIVELLALTGCRLNEIANLRWNEVDFQDQCLRLNDTKTGRSMRALGSPVIAELKKLPIHAGSEFLFPATRGVGSYQGTKRVAKTLFFRCGIDNASSHTLRHTFASVASGLGYSDATISGLLGHAGRGVTSRYIHRPDAAVLSAADAVAREIAGVMHPQNPETEYTPPVTLAK